MPGRFPPIVMTPQMKQWDDWGKAVLRDGDILFRRGDAKLLFGHFPFSRFLAAVSNSRFSHTGIVAIENGEPVVYDTTKAGVRRQPFSRLDPRQRRAVRRQAGPARGPAVHPPRRSRYCRELFARQVPFDYDLGIDDEAFYCVEMTEKAYRSNGMPLSEPVRLGDMENITRYPICVLVFLKISNLSLDQPVYFPGNEQHGIWSCPRLVTVYESKPTPDGGEGMVRPVDNDAIRSQRLHLRRRDRRFRVRREADLDFRRDSGKLTPPRPATEWAGIDAKDRDRGGVRPPCHVCQGLADLGPGLGLCVDARVGLHRRRAGEPPAARETGRRRRRIRTRTRRSSARSSAAVRGRTGCSSRPSRRRHRRRSWSSITAGTPTIRRPMAPGSSIWCGAGRS